MHVNGNANLENALSLSADELKQRKVEYVDIRNAAR